MKRKILLGLSLISLATLYGCDNDTTVESDANEEPIVVEISNPTPTTQGILTLVSSTGEVYFTGECEIVINNDGKNGELVDVVATYTDYADWDVTHE